MKRIYFGSLTPVPPQPDDEEVRDALEDNGLPGGSVVLDVWCGGAVPGEDGPEWEMCVDVLEEDD